MDTQCERVLRHLTDVGPIDPLTSWQELGVYRLGARIWDLRQAGHAIVKETKEVTNRWGESCRVAEYRLVQ